MHITPDGIHFTHVIIAALCIHRNSLLKALIITWQNIGAQSAHGDIHMITVTKVVGI